MNEETQAAARHAGHPTVLNYSLCAITHEANDPVTIAKPGQTVNCPDCREFKGYKL